MIEVFATTDDDVRDEEETGIGVEITVEVGVGINDKVEASGTSVEVAAFSVEIFEISWLAVSFSSGS